MAKAITSESRAFLNFTRASEATFVDSDGLIKTAKANEARLDHDPVTGEPLGLLVEESRTNIIGNSQQFPIALQNRTDTDIAPDVAPTIETVLSITGELNAYRVTNNDTQTIFVGSDPSSEVTGNHTGSIWVKGTQGQSIQCSLRRRVVANQSLNSFVLTGGWQRINVTRDFDTRHRVGLLLESGQTIEVFGFQIEQGSFPTSYIPTNGSQVTRVADSAKIDGAVFESFYNNTDGTLFIEFQYTGDQSSAVKTVACFAENNSDRALTGNFGTAVTHPAGSFFGNNTVKLAAPFKGSVSLNGYVDGVEYGTAYANGFQGINNLNLFKRSAIGRTNGFIKAVKFFPRALSDSELIALTTPETQP